MINTILQPKTMNRFIVNFLVQGTSVDVLSKQLISVNAIEYVRPPIKGNQCVISFHDDVDNQTFSALDSMWEKLIKIHLTMVDANETPLMRWEMSGGSLEKITHGPFDYATQAPVIIQATFACRSMVVKPIR